MGPDEAQRRNAMLLYVGITRARSELVLTYSRRLTPLMPTSAALYDRMEHE